MELDTDGCLLRILIGESDKHKGKPLYEWLVLRAREIGLAGATVIRGVMGFGANSRIHTAKILRLSADLPVVIEIVDTREKIERYLEAVEGNIKGGLATIENADVRFYRSDKKKVVAVIDYATCSCLFNRITAQQALADDFEDVAEPQNTGDRITFFDD
jgi:hypothetical protein